MKPYKTFFLSTTGGFAKFCDEYPNVVGAVILLVFTITWWLWTVRRKPNPEEIKAAAEAKAAAKAKAAVNAKAAAEAKDAAWRASVLDKARFKANAEAEAIAARFCASATCNRPLPKQRISAFRKLAKKFGIESVVPPKRCPKCCAEAKAEAEAKALAARS